jgi:hypothetical protein
MHESPLSDVVCFLLMPMLMGVVVLVEWVMSIELLVVWQAVWVSESVRATFDAWKVFLKGRKHNLTWDYFIYEFCPQRFLSQCDTKNTNQPIRSHNL